MKKLIKHTIILLLIAGIAISFSTSPAMAQSDPSAGAVDEDGDLVMEVLPSFLVGAGAQGPQAAGAQALPEGFNASPDLGVVIPLPVSPEGYVMMMDKTPTFTFSKVPGASKYQIQVWDSYGTGMLYSVKGSGNCGDAVCSFTPSTKLKTYGYNGDKGYYFWKVRAKTGDSWSDYSYDAYFYVISSGFTSTFNNHAKKWQPIYGEWFRVDPGYLKTKGITNKYASAIQREWFQQGFMYEVSMKRKVAVAGDEPSNRIYFMATPGNDVTDGWKDGYDFYYYDDGSWRLSVLKDDMATLLASGNSPYINKYGWNKLTVLTALPNIYFWINEHYLGFENVGDDPISYNSGYVGVAGFKNTGKTSLLVDKVSLNYSSVFPYPTVMLADGLPDPAYELTVDPAVVIPVE